MAWLNGLLVSAFFGLFAAGHARVIRRVDAYGGITTKSSEAEAVRKTGRQVKKALLIHSGLMRDYKRMWPIWEKNFINPSKKAGVEFTIAVSTDLRYSCDPEAADAFPKQPYKHPELITKNTCGCMRMGEQRCTDFANGTTNAEKASFAMELKNTYGTASKDGTVHIEDARTDELPTKSFNSVYTRARPILTKYENQTFDYIIVTRPDIVLANSQNFSHDTDEFNLVSMCNSHPGMNLIDGAFVRNNDEMHHRDWDWGYLLCDGAHQEAARPVMWTNAGECYDQQKAARKAGTQCTAPPRTKEWVGNGTFTCHSRACSWFQEMNGQMRFGNLDDTLFGVWPKNVSHRDAGQDIYKPPL